ncbi:hypothetical protein E8E14_010826 [Neopestalotiopsis sp. 37M]|nr:hypothetical protein E8E14_010826 [Neopestalotiopsis sp. 37M]
MVENAPLTPVNAASTVSVDTILDTHDNFHQTISAILLLYFFHLTHNEPTDSICHINNANMQFSYAAIIAILSYVAIATPVVRNVPDSCDTQYDQCVTAPDANISTCVSRQATCESNCQAGYDSCRTANDANLSTCVATFDACAGHLPN